MAGVNLSASPVTKWPTQAAGQSQSKAGWMVSLLAAGLSLAFPFSEQNKKLLPFSISVLGFYFFNRPAGEGNNREGLNICFHLMSFALALRVCSGEKPLQALIYTAAIREVMGVGEG